MDVSSFFGVPPVLIHEIFGSQNIHHPAAGIPMTQAVKLTMVALASWAYFAVTAGTVDLEPVLSNSVALYLGAPEYIFLGHITSLVSLSLSLSLV